MQSVEGSDVRIECKSSDDRHHPQWFRFVGMRFNHLLHFPHLNTILSDSQWVSFSNDQQSTNGQHIMFKNIRKSEEGRYRCQISGDENSVLTADFAISVSGIFTVSFPLICNRFARQNQSLDPQYTCGAQSQR